VSEGALFGAAPAVKDFVRRGALTVGGTTGFGAAGLSWR